MVLVPEPPVIGFGLNGALAPEGSPLTLKFTLPVKPPDGLTDAVKLVPLPCVMVREDGVAEMEKSGVGAEFTTNVTVVEWVRLPQVPVIVSV